MKEVEFEDISIEYANELMEIFNYYAVNTFAAYPEKSLPNEFLYKIIELSKGYPAYTIIFQKKIVGFCLLRAYNPFAVFRETAEISYFISNNFIGKGLGKIALTKLETEAKKLGIKTILASITSENIQSIEFHKRNGFIECGRFPETGKKFGKTFDIIWMSKKL